MRLRSALCLPSRTCLASPTVARPPRRPRPPHSKVSRPRKRSLVWLLWRILTSCSASSQKVETRPNSSHYNTAPVRSAALPPTPPMSSDASFDSYASSPSTKSVSQLSTQNYYYDSASPISHLESEAHRQQMVPRIPVQPAYAAPAFGSPYMSSPAMASYYPAMQPTPPPQPQVSGLYYQRPLPQVSSPLGRIVISMPSGVLTPVTDIPSHANGRPHAIVWPQPLAAPPLHLAILSCLVPSVTGSLYLPDMQQGLLPP